MLDKCTLYQQIPELVGFKDRVGDSRIALVKYGRHELVTVPRRTVLSHSNWTPAPKKVQCAHLDGLTGDNRIPLLCQSKS